VKPRNGSRTLTAVLTAAIAALLMAAMAAPAPAALEVTSFDGSVLDENGDPQTQAGGRPSTASTEFFVASKLVFGQPYPLESLKDASAEIPAGFVGNPQAIPSCSQAQFITRTAGLRYDSCPYESQVGYVTLHLGGVSSFGSEPLPFQFPLWNLDAPPGTPGVFGFSVVGTPAYISADIRTGDDYGITVLNANAPATLALIGLTFTFWGVPADPVHDDDRGYYPDGTPCAADLFVPPDCSNSSSASLDPYLTLPTSCVGPVETTLRASSWEFEDIFDTAGFISHDNTEPIPTPIGAEGCNAVPFDPQIEARPTTNAADSPSGLDVNLHIPQHEDCDPGPPVTCETATAHVRDTTVTLPKELTLNPAAGNGLDGCSLAEFGYTSTDEDGTIHTTPDPADCPNASRLGSVQVESPAIEDPLQGSVFLADPYANPFGSLLALYITIDDEKTGIVVKLAGEVHLDPQTGQVSATFERNPQLPFEDFALNFFGGAGGTLRTPALCGNYTTTSAFTPWTSPEGEDKSPEDNWQITQGANGGACANSAAQLPHAPSLDAGTVSPIAGAYSPMVINLRREDGSQNFSEVTLSPPPGLIGKLAGISPCPDAALAAAAAKSGQEEKANPSCPAASRVGTVHAAAGAGPAPYWTEGDAYLTGPYKGGPLGIAIVTPATAGPFDLGTVVVRSAIYLDSKTAQITAKADPLPTILQGIPLDIRAALIKLDRDQFTLTGTSCDPLAFTGSILSTLGQNAALQSRYQLGECSSLGFKPKMTLALKGGTKRRGHPSLSATLEPRPGDANMASISVALPPTELLDQSRIGTVCTRVQFAADQCPAASIYGTATVTTPLTDYPLTGNVYLRSSDNPLPDLVPDFRGPASQPLRIEASGKTDTVKGALRNTFGFVPDAPFTKLVVTLPGGKRGLIQNSTDICAKRYRATIKYTSQNGLALEQRPVVKTSCPKGKKRPKTHRRGNRRAVR
jgi:hypothetical protein